MEIVLLYTFFVEKDNKNMIQIGNQNIEIQIGNKNW